MVTVIATPNTTFNPSTASGTVYSIIGSGAFTMTRVFATIALETTETGAINSIDTSNAIQINIEANDINSLLGERVLDELRISYNAVNGTFDNVSDSIASDTLTISGVKLASWLRADTQIKNTGKYSTLYSGFKTFVAEYFGLSGSFASLYNDAGRLSFTDGTVTATGPTYGNLTPLGLFNLMKATTPGTDPAVGGGGGTQTAMGGSITIPNLSTLLRFAVDTNVFNNRKAVAAVTAVTAVPAVYDTDGTTIITPAILGVTGVTGVNFGVGNGFIAGDLIYVATGASATLTIGLTPERDTDPMNVVKTITTTTNTDGVTTTATVALLTRTLVAPILIRIVDSI